MIGGFFGPGGRDAVTATSLLRGAANQQDGGLRFGRDRPSPTGPTRSAVLNFTET